MASNQETIDISNTCVVCFKGVDIYSIGQCDHPVCFECSTRMRVLCRQNECPICSLILAFSMEVPCRTTGKSIREIGKIFEEPPGTIHYIIARYRELGTVNRPRSGRPEKLNRILKLAVFKEIHSNPSSSAPEIAVLLLYDYVK
uniref:RING-type domain-containing protein n=1 Tax=Rhodnius prolixus TaxID=13249 RepID=T1HDM7_RHOPR